MVPEALTSRDMMTPPKMLSAGLRVSMGRAPTEGVASHARGRPHLWAGPPGAARSPVRRGAGVCLPGTRGLSLTAAERTK